MWEEHRLWHKSHLWSISLAVEMEFGMGCFTQLVPCSNQGADWCWFRRAYLLCHYLPLYCATVGSAMLSLTVRWEDTAPASRGKWTEGADLCEAVIAVIVTICILQPRLLGCYSFFFLFFVFVFFWFSSSWCWDTSVFLTFSPALSRWARIMKRASWKPRDQSYRIGTNSELSSPHSSVCLGTCVFSLESSYRF